jgi:hypothetical protein
MVNTKVAQRRREVFFTSAKQHKKYFVSDVAGLPGPVLKDLILECHKELLEIQAIVQDSDPLLCSIKIKQKYAFVKAFYGYLSRELGNRRKGEAEQSAHDKMIRAWESEKRKVFYELVKGIVGESRFVELMDIASSVADQKYPNPTKPENRFLWQQEAILNE